MRYRALDANGDYVLGQGTSEFLVNSPQAVAQAVKTVLMLFSGEWFLDTTIGVPYLTNILGMGTVGLYDSAIQTAILNTQGVSSILSYSSSLDNATRALSISVNIDTIYGAVQIQQVI